MGWRGESRRHSLARKGVKTAKGKSVPKEQFNIPEELYFDDVAKGGWVIDDWDYYRFMGEKHQFMALELTMEGISGTKYKLDTKVRSIELEDGRRVNEESAWKDIIDGGYRIDDWYSGEDHYGKYLILKMEGRSGKIFSLDVKIRGIWEA